MWKEYTASALVAVAAFFFIAKHEGTIFKGYKDPVGIPTAGVGHTGSDVKVGKTYSLDIIRKWYNSDMDKAYKAWNRCLDMKPPMTLNQEIAFTSFTFNVGPGKKGVKDGFCVLKSGRKSTIRRRIEEGNVKEACNRLMDWTRAGGKVFKGLVNRRKQEKEICLLPDGDLRALELLQLSEDYSQDIIDLDWSNSKVKSLK